MARTILPLDSDYPSPLLALKKPPEITVDGELDLTTPRVAIVGARAADKGAENFASTLASRLARAGVCVVSGGARGIDGAAHRGALDGRGVTWVIAPFGNGAPCFPDDHANLFSRVVAAGGAMIHVLARGQKARDFPVRNRIMVALVHAVVVVQAGPKSGTLNTARHTLAQGRPLWVVPAAPWLESFTGSRQLLSDPKVHRLDSDEAILEVLAQVRGMAPTPAGVGSPEKAVKELEGDARVLVECLTVPRHRDELVQATGWSPSRLASIMFELEVEGRIIEEVDGRVRRNPRLHREFGSKSPS
jgi:DNA processing protein